MPSFIIDRSKNVLVNGFKNYYFPVLPVMYLQLERFIFEDCKNNLLVNTLHERSRVTIDKLNQSNLKDFFVSGITVSEIEKFLTYNNTFFMTQHIWNHYLEFINAFDKILSAAIYFLNQYSDPSLDRIKYVMDFLVKNNIKIEDFNFRYIFADNSESYNNFYLSEIKNLNISYLGNNKGLLNFRNDEIFYLYFFNR